MDNVGQKIIVVRDLKINRGAVRPLYISLVAALVCLLASPARACDVDFSLYILYKRVGCGQIEGIILASERKQEFSAGSSIRWYQPYMSEV
jgi:hypothetical protein